VVASPAVETLKAPPQERVDEPSFKTAQVLFTLFTVQSPETVKFPAKVVVAFPEVPALTVKELAVKVPAPPMLPVPAVCKAPAATVAPPETVKSPLGPKTPELPEVKLPPVTVPAPLITNVPLPTAITPPDIEKEPTVKALLLAIVPVAVFIVKAPVTVKALRLKVKVPVYPVSKVMAETVLLALLFQEMAFAVAFIITLSVGCGVPEGQLDQLLAVLTRPSPAVPIQTQVAASPLPGAKKNIKNAKQKEKGNKNLLLKGIY
jgi:hypothetical protein